MQTQLPSRVAAAGAAGEHLLDVRPVLDKGGDPFRLIIKSLEGLDATTALHLVVGFEPTPLYAVMQSLGRSAYTEERAGTFHVWFYASGDAAKPVAEEAERGELAAPVELDVSGLEPPTPMIKILQTLGELGPGAQLLVKHHREPVLLYEKLALRGYAARTTKRGEGDYLVHIAPAWVFEAR